MTRSEASRIRHGKLELILPYAVIDPDGRKRSDVAFQNRSRRGRR